jgi:hypothetical protein
VASPLLRLGVLLWVVVVVVRRVGPARWLQSCVVLVSPCDMGRAASARPPRRRWGRQRGAGLRRWGYNGPPLLLLLLLLLLRTRAASSPVPLQLRLRLLSVSPAAGMASGRLHSSSPSSSCAVQHRARPLALEGRRQAAAERRRGATRGWEQGRGPATARAR